MKMNIINHENADVEYLDLVKNKGSLILIVVKVTKCTPFKYSIMKLFLNSNTTIDIDIMNLVHPEKDWTPVLYKEHVFKLMNNRYGET